MRTKSLDCTTTRNRTVDPTLLTDGTALRLTARRHARRCPDVYLRPIANKLVDERTYITPSDNACVAISSSPIEFVPKCVNLSPAAITYISPSSFER